MEFELRWRFTDPKYTSLSSEDLNKINPVQVEESKKIWIDLLSQDCTHLMLIPSKNKFHIIDRFSVDTDEVEEGRKKISSKISLDENEPIYFFWSMEHAVTTTWGIFLKYWTDFCYPSDDNNLIYISEKGLMIFFVEERITLISMPMEKK